jgi:hypothetical protein
VAGDLTRNPKAILNSATKIKLAQKDGSILVGFLR